MNIDVQGQPIEFLDDGPRDGSPIVLLHAFPFNHAMWEAQIAALRERFRVIAPDFRGHGGSPAGDGQHTLEFYVDDVLGLLDALKIEKAILGGCSMGGYVALRLAERAPERVRALILADTRSSADTNEGKIKRAAGIRAIQAKGVAEFADTFLQGALAPETHRDHPEIVARARGDIAGNSTRGLCGSLLALVSRTDTTESLPKFKVPTLVLVGENDTITPPSDAEALVKNIPSAKLGIIPHAGHMSPLENPAAFNAAMMAFLNQL